MKPIRPAGPADATGIADLHVLSWRTAYAGILPAAYLAGEVVAERRRHWRRALERPAPGDFTLLVPGDPVPEAFVCVLAGREPGHDACIDNLHVRPDLTGRGTGRRLLGAAVQRLVGAGARSACLWVFDANAATVRLYQRLGGAPERRGFDDFAGANAPHTLYAWRDLPALAAACGGGDF